MAGVALGVAVTGCRGGGGRAEPTTVSASATRAPASSRPTTPGTDSGVERVAVEAAYRAFWPVLSTFARQPESRWRGLLGPVATDSQLALTISLSRTQRRNGIAVYGQPVPRAPEVTLGGGERAVVRDCADFSRTGQMDARTGRRKTVGIARNAVRVALVRGADGRWRVDEVVYPGGSC